MTDTVEKISEFVASILVAIVPRFSYRRKTKTSTNADIRVCANTYYSAGSATYFGLVSGKHMRALRGSMMGSTCGSGPAFFFVCRRGQQGHGELLQKSSYTDL